MNIVLGRDGIGYSLEYRFSFSQETIEQSSSALSFQHRVLLLRHVPARVNTYRQTPVTEPV